MSTASREPAVSPIAEAADALRRMIALSATFQAAGGSLDDVYYTEQAFATPRPWAIVTPGEQMAWRLDSGGAQNYFRPAGSMFVLLAIDTPADYFSDQVAAEHFAGNYFGGVLDDVAAVAAADDPDGNPLLAITAIDLVWMAENDEREHADAGRFYLAGFNVQWGDG